MIGVETRFNEGGVLTDDGPINNCPAVIFSLLLLGIC